MSVSRVQECDSCGEEAVPNPAGLSPKALVAPPRGQEVKESMCLTSSDHGCIIRTGYVTGSMADFSQCQLKVLQQKKIIGTKRHFVY